MTIFDVIKADHRKLRSFLSKLNNTTEEQAPRRRKLFKEFKKALVNHAKSEEQAVYVPLKGKEKTRDISFEGYEEHHLVDHLMKQLSTLSPADEKWTAKITVVRELLQHHMEEEEESMFAKMRQNFNRFELEDIRDDMREEKKKH